MPSEVSDGPLSGRRNPVTVYWCGLVCVCGKMGCDEADGFVYSHQGDYSIAIHGQLERAGIY